MRAPPSLPLAPPLSVENVRERARTRPRCSRIENVNVHVCVCVCVCALVRWCTGKKPGELNVTDDHGRTPLHIAALSGHVEIRTLLLSSAMLVPFTHTHARTVNFLIAKRAIIEAVDNNGLTPLHCACSCTNPEALFEVCSLLLTVAQADVTKKTHAGTTPLHYFVRNPCVDPVMYFETLVRARVFFFSLAPRSWHTAYQPP